MPSTDVLRRAHNRAVVRCVGVDQLVYGSDHPVVAAQPAALLGAAAGEAMVNTNVARLLGRGAMHVARAA